MLHGHKRSFTATAIITASYHQLAPSASPPLRESLPSLQLRQPRVGSGAADTPSPLRHGCFLMLPRPMAAPPRLTCLGRMLIGSRLRNPTARRCRTTCPRWPPSGGLVQSTSTFRRGRLYWSCIPHQAAATCCLLLLSDSPHDQKSSPSGFQVCPSAALTLRKGQCRRRSLPRSLEALVALPQGSLHHLPGQYSLAVIRDNVTSISRCICSLRQHALNRQASFSGTRSHLFYL